MCPARSSGLAPALALGLGLALVLLVASSGAAEARQRREAVALRERWSHGWDREVGRRLAQGPPDRRERRLLGEPRQVPLDEATTLRRIESLGERGARVTRFGSAADGLPLYRVDLPCEPPRGGPAPLRVLISAGVHGNETVGPAAALALIERALHDRHLRTRFRITVLPLLNRVGARRTPDGLDLNREAHEGSPVPTMQAIAGTLAGERYDLFVDLHGAAGKDGFFLIRAADDGLLSRRSLGAMRTSALLDAPPASPSVGVYQLHALGGAGTDTEGTLKSFMASRGAPLSYTLEAPGRLSPERQVQGMVKLLRSVLDNTARHGGPRGGRAEALVPPARAGL